VSPFRPAFAPSARRVPAPAPGLALGAILLLAGCAVPERANVGALFRDVTGAALAERLPPPGLDEPTPNLASVPPIPDRPDGATRAAILRGLEGTRDAAGEPLAIGRADAPLAMAAAPGRPAIPAAPPGPPRLSRAPVIPWAAEPVPWAAEPVRATPEAAIPEAPAAGPEPGAIPAPPPAELLAPMPGMPPPPPSRDLLAP